MFPDYVIGKFFLTYFQDYDTNISIEEEDSKINSIETEDITWLVCAGQLEDFRKSVVTVRLCWKN